MKKLFFALLMSASSLTMTGCLDELFSSLGEALIVNVSIKNTTTKYEVWYKYEKKDNGRNEWKTIKEGSVLPGSTDYMESPGANYNGTVRVLLVQAQTWNNPAFPTQGWSEVGCTDINKVEFVITGNGTYFSVQGYGTKQ